MRRRFRDARRVHRRRFAGNPLAVVLDADGLDTAAMQAIAREFNHPETVFVLPPQIRRTARGLRIFTPARELPFAGHPTVGTAVLLGAARRRRRRPRDRAGGGDRAGALHARGATAASAAARASSSRNCRPKSGRRPTTAAIAAALGARARAISASTAIAPSRWSAGNPVHFRAGAPASPRSRAARPDPASFDAAFGASGRGAAYLYLRRDRRARPRFPRPHVRARLGITEDPATGSAAAAFAGVLAALAGLPDGEHAFAIEQGYEMGRPSLIELAMTIARRQARGRLDRRRRRRRDARARSRHDGARRRGRP